MRLALIAALLLAASATAEPPAPEGAPAATATSPASPHNRPDACEACHTTAGPAVGAVSPGSEEACVGCHPGVEVHPVGIEPRDVAVPDGWPLADGALACSTCHSEPSCDAARSTEAPWFRGGPVRRISDFCVRCHDVDDFRRRDPHHPTTRRDAGDPTCAVCHASVPDAGAPAAASGLRLETDRVCRECHPGPHHLGVVSHLDKALSDEAAARLGRRLPLDEGRVVRCWTCHDVHGADAPGPSRAGSPLRPVTLRAAEALRALARGDAPAASADAEHPPLLALPAEDGSLCRACHGDGG